MRSPPGRRLRAAAAFAAAAAVAAVALSAADAAPRLAQPPAAAPEESPLQPCHRDYTVTDEEASAPPEGLGSDEVDLAYFIQVAPSSAVLVPRLLRAVYHPSNWYVLHFDTKIPAETVDAVVAAAAAAVRGAGSDLPSNVHLLPREPVTYRGITAVLNTLSAIEASLRHASWRYFLNLSAADYPLLSAGATRRLLSRPDLRTRRANFLSLHPPSEWASSAAGRFGRLTVDVGLSFSPAAHHSVLVPTTVRNPAVAALNVTLAKGSAWMVLTRPFCDHALTSAFARKALLALGHGLSAAEHYFPTLLVNSDVYARTVLPHSLRAVYWEAAAGAARGAVGQHPVTLDAVDRRAAAAGGPPSPPWEARLSRSPYLFARKFSTPDAPLLAYLDRCMNGGGGAVPAWGGRGGGKVDWAAVREAERRAHRHVDWLMRLGTIPDSTEIITRGRPSPTPTPAPSLAPTSRE